MLSILLHMGFQRFGLSIFRHLEGEPDVSVVLHERLHRLREIATESRRNATYSPLTGCSNSRFLKIGGGDGRTGNNFIQFSHGLWFASMSKRTYILPDFTHRITNHIDLGLLRTLFCVKDYSTSSDVVKLRTGDIYVATEVWKKSDYKNFILELPPYDEDLFLTRISDHNRQVAGAMWGSLTGQYTVTN